MKQRFVLSQKIEASLQENNETDEEEDTVKNMLYAHIREYLPQERKITTEEI